MQSQCPALHLPAFQYQHSFSREILTARQRQGHSSIKHLLAFKLHSTSAVKLSTGLSIGLGHWPQHWLHTLSVTREQDKKGRDKNCTTKTFHRREPLLAGKGHGIDTKVTEFDVRAFVQIDPVVTVTTSLQD